MSIPSLGSDFPKDIVREVLTRLPPESLMRFRCVSKSWCAFIDSPEFVRWHLNRSTIDSIKSPQFVINIFGGNGKPSDNWIWAMKADDNLHTDARRLAPPVINPTAAIAEGCCNGLICMRYPKTKELFLWNPGTRKSFVVPKITNVINRHYMTPSFCGFGYDDLTDEYKVLQFVRHHQYPGLSYDLYVYRTKRNYWRKLPDFPYQMRNICTACGGSGVLANWALHWTVYHRGVYFIAAIDLRTEKYRLFPIPKVLQSIFNYYSTEWFGYLSTGFFFEVMNGYLCLCIIPSDEYGSDDLSLWLMREYGRDISLWLMKDYGVQDSWTKFVVPRPGAQIWLPIVLHPAGLLEDDKMLFALEQWGTIAMKYDLKNQIYVKKVKTALNFPGILVRLPVFERVYKWVPSIVSVPNSREKKGNKRDGN